MTFVINFTYLIATILFILGLKKLSSPASARQGNALSAVGMLIAIIATLFSQDILDYQWITASLFIGSILGIFMTRTVAMTAMPEMVALLNGFGGISSLLVGLAAYAQTPSLPTFFAIVIILSILIGGVTFTGSLIAWGKLKELYLENLFHCRVKN